jgi:hypothetical protein
MKKLSLCLIAFLLICPHKQLLCQSTYNGLDVIFEACTNCLTNNPTYTVNDTLNTLDLISDFGPRNINANCTYNFHGGIDYTVPNIEDRGYHLRAVVGGQIYRVRDANTKYILIEGDDHNFSYFHMFRDGALPQTAGDMDIDYLDSYGPAGTSQNYRPLRFK